MYDWQLSLQRSLNASTDLNRCTAKAELITFKPISLHEPVFLLIEVQDFQGKSIDRFDPVTDRLMQLIVVSDDLYTFDALYPTYRGNGRFTVEAIFSKPGSYTLFSRYQPTEQTELVSALKLIVPGSPLSSPAISLSAKQLIHTTEVQLRLPQPIIQFEKEMTIAFQLRDQSIHLGRSPKQQKVWGNLVIVNRSSNLTKVAYIPTRLNPDSTEHQLEFTAQFHEANLYKMWLQFERNGKLLIADFWLNLDSLKSHY